jgi:hypothetical protein
MVRMRALLLDARVRISQGAQDERRCGASSWLHGDVRASAARKSGRRAGGVAAPLRLSHYAPQARSVSHGMVRM